MKKLLNLLPLLAPFPEGYAVYDALVKHLEWPVWVAIPAAAIVGLIGFFSLQVAGQSSEHNRGLKKSEVEFEAGMMKPYIGVGIWFVGSTLLVLFLEIGVIAKLAPVALVIVGGSGSFIASLHYALDEKKSALSEHRNQHRSDLIHARTARQNASTAKAKPAQSQQGGGTMQGGAEPVPAHAKIVCRNHADGCGRDDFKTQEGENAHQRFCAYRAELRVEKIVAINSDQQVNSGG